MRRATALHAVPDVEDDEPVVPVGEIGEPVHYHHVVQVAAGFGLLRLPAGDLLRVDGIPEVDHAERACGVVGDVGVPLVDVRAVHPTRHRLGVLGHGLGVAGVARVEDDDPVPTIGRALP